MIEQLLEPQPRRMFELLMSHDETDVGEVPGIGEKLLGHRTLYYEFRQSAIRFESDLLTAIKDRDWFPAAWKICQRYVMCRLLGLTKEQIIARGNFLNYDLTWDKVETIFERVSGDAAITSAASQLNAQIERLDATIVALKESAADRIEGAQTA